MLKEMKGINKWKVSHAHGLEECCKDVHTTQSNLQNESNPIKIPMAYFKEIGQTTPKLYRTIKDPK